MDGPQPLKQEDDWVRGNQLELGKRIVDADPDGDRPLWDMLYLGTAAVRLMKGVADQKDIGRVMAHVVAQCEIDVQAGARALLAMEDTTAEAYRTLHFNTRVSAAILNRLNQLVRNSQQAADAIEQMTHPTAR